MKLSLAITISDDAWREESGISTATRRAIRACVKETGHDSDGPVEISILLCGDPEIKKLNRTWRGIDKATNVLSFPSSFPGVEGLLGDIAISHQTLRREVRRSGNTFLEHYLHMVVHGFLHLAGFDHEDDDQADIMEAREKKILAGLGVRDPYAPRRRSMAKVK